MNGKYKWALWTVALLILAAILAVMSASALVGSDWARRHLIQKLEAATGRRFHAEKLTLRLTPKLHLEATEVRISNPDWAGASPDFLHVAAASFDISPLPLLIGRVRVERAQADGVQLFLERSASAANWDFKAAGAKADTAPRNWKKIAHAAWLPDRLSIRRAQVQYRAADGKTARWELPSLSLQAAAGRAVQGELQLLTDKGMVHLTLLADNLSGIGNNGATTPVALHVDTAQQSAGSADVKGRLGLGAGLSGTDLHVNFDAPTHSPLLTLMGLGGRDLAAIKLDFALHERAGSIEIAGLMFMLGDLRVSGQGALDIRQLPLRIEGQLHTDFLNWEKVRQDAGLPPMPPKPVGALFRDTPLAWPLLQRVHGFTADVGLQIGVLKLLSGVPLQNVKLQAQLQPDLMSVPAFSANFMSGTATADAVFSAHDEQVKLNLKASGISIEQWRKVLRKPALLTGGPLAVDAQISATGGSMQKLASTLTGPVRLRMGHAVVLSSRASETESLLTGLVPVLAGKRAERMEVVCAVASLPFKSGRATASSIAGARTESSQLLTDGVIDLHDQTLDLHGRVTGVNGIRLGASMFVGDVNIGGKLGKPKFRLDAQGLLGTAARVGAAILSGGLSVVGSTLWDAYADDACKVAGQRPDRKPPARGELALPR
jgi:uncharacterized protein involved in outer membrane biogenesis